MIPQLYDADHLDFDGPIVHVVESNRLRSEGYLELPPMKELPRHHRSVEEHLVQMEGESLVTVFDEHGDPVLHHLSKGSELRIVPGAEHQHANPFGHPSITKWSFEGDVSEVIAEQRRVAKRIAEERHTNGV